MRRCAGEPGAPTSAGEALLDGISICSAEEAACLVNLIVRLTEQVFDQNIEI
jgi:hypothetical protein